MATAADGMLEEKRGYVIDISIGRYSQVLESVSYMKSCIEPFLVVDRDSGHVQ